MNFSRHIILRHFCVISPATSASPLWARQWQNIEAMQADVDTMGGFSSMEAQAKRGNLK